MKEQKAKKVVRKIKKSGVVKLKPKISGKREKDASLIADHIAEATNKGKPIKQFFLFRWFNYVGKKYNEFVDRMFGM
tara:strand:- start:180 stop:410 length:231 start_codon:yes stop_codon:yes gene_type:complete